VIPSGTGLNMSCSRLPSSASPRNKPSRASSEDSSADTHKTPVPTSLKTSVFGDNASGNSDTTMTKNSSGFVSSLNLRKAIRRSRAKIVEKAFIRRQSSMTSVPGSLNSSG
jgi:hypothetical protein